MLYQTSRDWVSLKIVGREFKNARDSVQPGAGTVNVSVLDAANGEEAAALIEEIGILPDIFIDQASPEAMYRVAGMEAAQIEERVLDVLGIAVVGRRA